MKTEADNRHDPKPDCNSASVLKYAPSRYDDFIHLFPLHGTVVGGDLKPSFQQFTYYNSLTSQKLQPTKYPVSASVYIGHIFSFEEAAFLRAEYQDSFKDATAGALCPKTSTSQFLTCVSGPIGAPTETKTEIITLEYRKIMTGVPFFNNIAFTTDIRRDVKGKVNSIEFPLYLFADPGKGLTGGFSLGYRGDTHATTGIIFIGAPFSVF